jgi:hypothetical protein
VVDRYAVATVLSGAFVIATATVAVWLTIAGFECGFHS